MTELDSFVQKFHQLWSAGHSAHLDLDTHAGIACVGLRVQLGHPLHPTHHRQHYKKLVAVLGVQLLTKLVLKKHQTKGMLKKLSPM